MGAVTFLHQFNLPSREGKAGPASKSEIRRWLQAGAVVLNGTRLADTSDVQFPVTSLVLFPKGKRITLR
jgi:hypothetical protein